MVVHVNCISQIQKLWMDGRGCIWYIKEGYRFILRNSDWNFTTDWLEFTSHDWRCYSILSLLTWTSRDYLGQTVWDVMDWRNKLRYKNSKSFIWLLYDWCMIAVRLLYDCCMIVVWLLYDSCMIAVWLLYDCCRSGMIAVWFAWKTHPLNGFVYEARIQIRSGWYICIGTDVVEIGFGNWTNNPSPLLFQNPDKPR